jgi:hypothetical protein
MNKKNNKDLLNEEIKKFNLLSEYTFYEDRAGETLNNDLILGVYEAEEDNEPAFGDEEPLDTPEVESNPEGGEEEPAEGGFGDEESGDELDLSSDESTMEEPDPMDDAIELDVTELVKGSEEAKASADSANAKIDQLMGMVNKLEGQLDGMSKISQKIDNLETEIEKRNPTEDEKIEMRSLDSYPYSLKLTDFWSNQKGQYDIMNIEDKKEEYELNKDSINSDYVESNIKSSFDKDEFTEEEI